MILNRFWVHKEGVSTKPTTPDMYMHSLRMFKVILLYFFDFIVSIFWYLIMKIECDYRGCLNKTKLYQIIPN